MSSNDIGMKTKNHLERWFFVGGAGEGIRTLDIQLGKLTFYH